jgi:hypothetical protein
VAKIYFIYKNKETAIAALELIEQHFGMTSPIYLFKTRDLSKSENHEILDAMFMSTTPASESPSSPR